MRRIVRLFPITQRLTTPRVPYPLTVIGIARDADVAIWREKELSIYVPADTTRAERPLELLVRTTGDRDLVTSELRQAARAVDSPVRHVLLEVLPMDDVLRFWAVPARAAAIAAAVLGGLALALSTSTST